MKYRKKPVVIEAVQWDGTGVGLREIEAFMGADAFGSLGVSRYGRTGGLFFLVITTLEGAMRANPGDWIIRGIKGEYYPCKPDIFEATYEPVEEES
jgi:hypothetical protein